MSASNIAFQITEWDKIPATTAAGANGTVTVRTLQLGALRIRRIDYSAGYFADHWCQIGHLVFVLEGELVSELENGATTVIKAGSSYVVSDGLSSHRSHTTGPVKLLVVDGGFLK